MQVNTMRMLYTHAMKGDNSIIFWQDNVTIIADGSKLNSDVYFIVGYYMYREIVLNLTGKKFIT
jgi:hypothetical protein